MKSIIPTIVLLMTIGLSYWWFKTANKKPSRDLIFVIVLEILLVLIILLANPLIFASKNYNNIVLYFIYLAILGTVFYVPILGFKKKIIEEGRMPKEIKQILLSYLAMSALLLILIIFEAFNLR